MAKLIGFHLGKCRRGLAALAAMLSLLAAPGLAADRITARLEVYGLMGLHVLRLQTQLEEAGDRYSIAVNYATTGVAGLIVDQSTRAEAQGRIVGLSAQPDSFRSTTRRNGAERQNHVNYRPDGSLDAGSVPPPPNPVSPDAARGTIDNLTAYFRLERQLAAKRTCNMTVQVFDGRHRYDLVFEDAGQEKLDSDGGQKFEGTAIACKMTRHLKGVPDEEEGEGARRGTIWYVPLLPGDVMVPVRMQLRTQIGTVDAYLAEVHGRGVNLVLME